MFICLSVYLVYLSISRTHTHACVFHVCVCVVYIIHVCVCVCVCVCVRIHHIVVAAWRALVSGRSRNRSRTAALVVKGSVLATFTVAREVVSREIRPFISICSCVFVHLLFFYNDGPRSLDSTRRDATGGSRGEVYSSSSPLLLLP